jgi:hypothetical protein
MEVRALCGDEIYVVVAEVIFIGVEVMPAVGR